MRIQNWLLSDWCFVAVLALAALVSGCGPGERPAARPVPTDAEPQLQRFEYHELHMGVRTRLVVFADGEEAAERACRAAFDRVAELEQIMSDYRPSSELMRLCARSGGEPVTVSPELFAVLERAYELSRLTDGAFDITASPLIRLWRTARQTQQFPPADELASARQRVGWSKVALDRQKRTVQLLADGMQLDLGGIAKGYAGDQAIAVLKEHGIDRALFEAGGDIVVGDPPPGETGWGIELPPEEPAAPGRIVRLANRAISTSGDLYQFVVIDGVRYSHIVDPRTGLGLVARHLVTVTAPDGITSDSLATAISVLGPERGREVARHFPGVDVSVHPAIDEAE